MQTTEQYAAEAQRLADRGLDGDNLDDDHRKNLLLAAQVFATLAAATAQESIWRELTNSPALG